MKQENKNNNDNIDFIPFFTGLDLENIKITKAPDLPEVQFKKGRYSYKVTDMRYLSEYAKECFNLIVSHAAHNPDLEKVTFNVTDLDENIIKNTGDILSGIKYYCSKSGEGGYRSFGHLLYLGSSIGDDGEKKTFTVYLNEDHVKRVYEYAHGKDKIDYYELCMEIGKRN